ncbi:MAG: alpha-ketoglutarate-dependent 2,4-dichlorophenoxyacetate dioxygenase [Gammaproteobacteria bacterium]|jgi:alpha-ketoglutarate-dependent 2,4-dichlorophenoxyacetate dioxygenase
MSQMHFEPLHADFGATVTGIDLTDGLTPDTVQAIDAAMDEYSFLCFPDQDMNDDAQLALTRALGDPEPNHVKYGATGVIDYFGTVGNVVDDKTKKGNDDPHTRYQKGNNLWHTDSSFRLVPAKFSINHAYEVPGEGGETEFISTRAAFSRLPQDKQATIEPLQVLHDYVFSRAQTAPVDPNHAASLPPIPHKLVRTNPRNGRKNFYAGSHARSIIGWHGVQSRELIDGLLDGAAQPEYIYAHGWNAGDTVLWDNRCLLHRGAGYDADRWRRRMRQTRVEGLGPTTEE